MIGRKFRLPAAEFPMRQPVLVRSEYFSFKVSKNRLGCNRFAVIISSRVDTHSVRRHFWKRRILDWARSQISQGETWEGKDILITAFPPLNKLSEADAQREFKKLFAQAMRALT